MTLFGVLSPLTISGLVSKEWLRLYAQGPDRYRTDSTRSYKIYGFTRREKNSDLEIFTRRLSLGVGNGTDRYQ